MFSAVMPAWLRCFPTDEKPMAARFVDRPTAHPVLYIGTEDGRRFLANDWRRFGLRLRDRCATLQIEPMGLADDGISGNATQFRGNLPC